MVLALPALVRLPLLPTKMEMAVQAPASVTIAPSARMAFAAMS